MITIGILEEYVYVMTRDFVCVLYMERADATNIDGWMMDNLF